MARGTRRTIEMHARPVEPRISDTAMNFVNSPGVALPPLSHADAKDYLRPQIHRARLAVQGVERYRHPLSSAAHAPKGTARAHHA